MIDKDNPNKPWHVRHGIYSRLDGLDLVLGTLEGFCKISSRAYNLSTPPFKYD